MAEDIVVAPQAPQPQRTLSTTQQHAIGMLKPDDTVTAVDYDEELAVVVVRTKRKTNYEKKLKKKVQTSGCAQGTWAWAAWMFPWFLSNRGRRTPTCTLVTSLRVSKS